MVQFGPGFILLEERTCTAGFYSVVVITVDFDSTDTSSTLVRISLSFQLVERLTVDQMVSGSIPDRRKYFDSFWFIILTTMWPSCGGRCAQVVSRNNLQTPWLLIFSRFVNNMNSPFRQSSWLRALPPNCPDFVCVVSHQKWSQNVWNLRNRLLFKRPIDFWTP